MVALVCSVLQLPVQAVVPSPLRHLVLEHRGAAMGPYQDASSVVEALLPERLVAEALMALQTLVPRRRLDCCCCQTLVVWHHGVASRARGTRQAQECGDQRLCWRARGSLDSPRREFLRGKAALSWNTGVFRISGHTIAATTWHE